MNDIVNLLVREGYQYSKRGTLENKCPTYVMNYNGIRNWVIITVDTVRMYSIPEGTDGETTVADTGVLTSPSVSLIQGVINNIKKEIE